MATYAKPAGMPVSQPLQFDHLSFNVPDEAALLSLQERLRSAGVEVTRVVDHGMIHSIYFTDNNGIALEASYWLVDATAASTEDRSAFYDPDPVPAVAELERNGELGWLPTTKLVDGPSGIG
jgi:catechol 2,3-dioxygenase-like lactoylglutathione lyase family enzyme